MMTMKVMSKKTKRNRPRISTTLSPYTMVVLVEESKNQAFDKIGPTIDFIVHDWVGLKRAMTEAKVVMSIAAAGARPPQATTEATQ